MRKRKIPVSLQRQVRRDAKQCCGYCLTQRKLIGRPLSMEHLLPESKGGKTVRENLWLACRRCNEFRGAHTHAIDPLSGDKVPLFNPRTQTWVTHFVWSEDTIEIIGLTPTGRATVAALRLNNEDIKEARAIWVMTGYHPPQD